MSGGAFSTARFGFADRQLLSLPVVTPRVLKFGKHSWQRVFIYHEAPAHPAPFVVLVDQGSWKSPVGAYPTSWIIYRLIEAGFVVATIGADQTASVEDGDTDNLAAGIAFLRAHADDLRIDPDRIVLIGNEDGAYFTTLLGTDESYLAKNGVPLNALRGVVTINGNGFDIRRQMVTSNSFTRETLRKAFGAVPARQYALSPAAHLSRPNAPAFLLMAAENESNATERRRLWQLRSRRLA